MKTILLLLLLVPAGIFAQTANRRAYDKGRSVVSVGYGFINVWTTFLDKVIDIPDYHVKATGPVTLVYEYGISRRISAGILGSYSRVRGESKRFQLKDQISFWTLHARANYHVFTTERWDGYFGGGIGFNNAKYKNLDPHTVGN